MSFDDDNDANTRIGELEHALGRLASAVWASDLVTPSDKVDEALAAAFELLGNDPA